jgi:hypothetical protein
MICHTQEQAETLRLATDADMAYVRSVVEDPSVRPTFGPWPDDIEDFALFVFPGGVYGAEVRADYSVYVHLAVLPEARGRTAILAMKMLVCWFFMNTPCPRVAGWTPSDNRAGFMFNRLCGARRRGEAKGRTLFAVTRREWERQG